jgi:hypothetical protein
MTLRPKTILEELTDTQTIWAKVTDMPTPPERTIIRWLAQHGYVALERAIVKIPFRFQNMHPELDHVVRFISVELATRKKDSRSGTPVSNPPVTAKAESGSREQ